MRKLYLAMCWIPFLLMGWGFGQNYLGLYLSPDFNHRNLYLWADDEFNSGNAIIQSRKGTENGIFGMSYGVLYSNATSAKTVTEGGVGICTRGYQTVWTPQVNNPSTLTQIKTKFYYMDLPMRLKWYPKGRESNTNFFLAPGFTGHFMFRQVTINKTDIGGNINRNKTIFAFALSSAFRVISVSVAAGAGMDIKAGENAIFTLHPEFRYHISSLGSTATVQNPVDIRTFFWSTGLRTSLTFDLGS